MIMPQSRRVCLSGTGGSNENGRGGGEGEAGLEERC